MAFQVTIHRTPTSSTVCAVFSNHDDALLFTEQYKKYDADQPIHWEYSITELKSHSLPSDDQVTDPFIVTTDMTVNPTTILAFIRSINEVYLFLGAKFSADKKANIHNTYFVFQKDAFIEKHDQDPALSKQEEKEKVFRPTPLSTKLRLGPGAYWRDPDEEEK